MGALWRMSYVRQRTRRPLKASGSNGGLAEFDRRVLEYLTTHGSSDVLARRARIILSDAASGMTNMMVSRETGMSIHVVILWKRRFSEHGLEGLLTAEGAAPDFQMQRNNRRYRKIFDALDKAINAIA